MSVVQEMLSDNDLPGAISYIESLRGKELPVDQVQNQNPLEDDDLYVTALLLSIKRPKPNAKKLTFGVRAMNTYDRLLLFR